MDRARLLRSRLAAALILAPTTFLPACAAASDALIGSGEASYYRHGTRTASGERFDPQGLTAAHRSLPFGTRVRVVDAASGREVVVRINDRGPFHGGRVIDLAQGAASRLGMVGRGVANVHIYAVD